MSNCVFIVIKNGENKYVLDTPSINEARLHLIEYVKVNEKYDKNILQYKRMIDDLECGVNYAIWENEEKTLLKIFKLKEISGFFTVSYKEVDTVCTYSLQKIETFPTWMVKFNSVMKQLVNEYQSVVDNLIKVECQSDDQV